MSDEGNMNYLFYLGIIIPTLITLILFVVFIYCWFLQKARKEVLTKRYDPHGKMRKLGMSLEPPPPPDYCRIDDHLLRDDGEINVGYDVSRSPSTEQEARGRPLYQSYHDSGISGFSPSQELEPRPGLQYRTCPDSGISGFGSVMHPSSSGCLEPSCHCYNTHRQQGNQHNVQVQLHPQPNQRSLHQHQYQPQAMLHQNLVQASVHPSHGVCYGDDMAHTQSPQHYNSPSINPSSLTLTAVHLDRTNLPFGAIAEYPIPSSNLNGLAVNHEHYPLSLYGAESSSFSNHFLQDHVIQSEQQQPFITTVSSTIPTYPQPNTVTPNSVHSFPNRNNMLLNRRTPSQMPNEQDNSLEEETSLTEPARNIPIGRIIQTSKQSYRDSGVSENGQTASSGDRPDSQASQSSTTDSEDSGFRSSHAAPHNVILSKTSNPLLKPLRKSRNPNHKPRVPRANKPPKDSIVKDPTPLTTLNPQNLQNSLINSPAMDISLDLAHRSASRMPQSNSPLRENSEALKSNFKTSSSCDHSPSHDRRDWSSENDPEKHRIDLNDISTHLSWNYLQDVSNVSATGNAETVLIQNLTSPTVKHITTDKNEILGYSVV